MFPPLFCCAGPEDGRTGRRRYQERKWQMLAFMRDGLERQLAAVNAAISTLERQMERDQAESGS
ncbi:sigma factor SigF [Cyanobium sp. FGCU-52]|nr:sigma factor SigF [Cyanobium sp. FGCU52]